MKVTFDTLELQKRLAQLGAVVARKAQEPLYAQCRLSADASGVTLQGIDVDSTLTVKLAAASADGVGSILLEYKKLNTVVQSIKAKEAFVTFTDETSASVSAGKFKGVMQGTPSEKFNELPVVQSINDKPEIGGFAIGLPGLKEQIEQVSFAIPAPDGKFVVPSALLESAMDVLRLVATNGQSMSITQIGANLGEFSFTLPKPLLEIILKLDGGPTATVTDTENGFYIQTELELLTYAKTHSEFPPYTRVIPKTGSATLVAVLKDKEALVSALKLAKPFCDGKEPGIKFTFKTEPALLELHAVHVSEVTSGASFTDTADDELEAEVTGEPNSFRLNIDKLLPFLERATFPVTLYFTSGTKPVDMHSNGGNQEKPVFRFLLMPMKSDD